MLASEIRRFLVDWSDTKAADAKFVSF